MPAENSVARKRVQIDFSDDAYAKLTRLREELNAESNTDVIRRGLRLLEWLVQKRLHEEVDILTAKGDDVRKVEFMGLL